MSLINNERSTAYAPAIIALCVGFIVGLIFIVILKR